MDEVHGGSGADPTAAAVARAHDAVQVAVRARDAAAQVREIEPMVRAICRGRLGDVDGDDAAQRALLTVWRALDNDRDFESVWGYAAACARFETQRSRQDFARRPTPIADVGDRQFVEPAPGPEERALRAEEAAQARARVDELLAQLAPRQAEVMRASVLSDRGSSEAAEELGITPNGVRSAQVRAMAHMRELCDTHSPNPLASPVPYTQRRSHEPMARAEAARRADERDRSRPEQASTDGRDPEPVLLGQPDIAADLPQDVGSGEAERAQVLRQWHREDAAAATTSLGERAGADDDASRCTG